MIRAALLIAPLLLAGCLAPAQVPGVTDRPGRVVRVRGYGQVYSSGRGAVVGEHLVLTASHVWEVARYVVGAPGRARLVAYLPPVEPDAEEPLALLRVAASYDPEEVYALGEGESRPGVYVSTVVGRQRSADYLGGWDSYPGSSGSPVLDAQGRLVGVHWGTVGGRTAYLRLGPSARHVIEAARRAP